MTFPRASEALSRCLTYARSPGADLRAEARHGTGKRQSRLTAKRTSSRCNMANSRQRVRMLLPARVRPNALKKAPQAALMRTA